MYALLESELSRIRLSSDYGIEYLVNDRGGCCPRLGADGSVIGLWGDDAS